MLDLAYSASGSGPAVLCIQGVGVAGSGWQPQVAALSARFRVVTFDNRGTGRSADGGGPLTIEAMASDACAILDEERIDRCHVVGHSMGGLIALRMALTARARVKSLALLCTFADGAAPTRLTLRMAVLGLRTRVGTRAMRRRGMLRMILPAAYLEEVDQDEMAARYGALFGRDLGTTPPIVSRQLKAMARYSAQPQLAELDGLPALVVSGRHDPIAPPILSRTIAHGIPGARYVEFADASHALPIQCADRMNALLLEHFEASEPQAP